MSVEIDGVNKIIKTDTISEATSANNLTLDVAGDIILDADGGDWYFKDAGTDIAHFVNSSGDFLFITDVSDKDIQFRGLDGASQITALTLDMSDSGMAHFNNYIKVSDRVVGSSNLVLTSTDANEKIHLDASGYMKFETNGTERMRIHSGGNISIGSTSDPAKLSVTTASSGVSPSSNADELLIEGNDNAGMTIGSGTSGAGNIYFGDSGDNDIGIIRYDHGDNAMLLVTNASERMRIDSSGRIGIGTTSPTAKLQVNGNVSLGTLASGTANSSYRQIQLNNGLIADSGGTNSSFQLLQNAYVGTGNNNFAITGSGASHASRLMMTSGVLTYATQNGLTADNQITFSEKFKVDTSGNATLSGKINVGGSSSTKGSVINRTSSIGSEVFAAAGGMHSIDDRDPKPGNFPVGQYSNFSSYAGTGQSTPYADVMILDTFGHSSGGNANAIFVSKSDPNDIKIAQQTALSTSTFASGTQVNIDTSSISDASVKENVQTITDCLSKVAQLRPVTFEWTDEYINNGMSRNASEKTFTGGELATFYTDDDELPEGKEVGDIKTEGSAPTRVIPATKTTNVGLIAQEVEAVIPTVVHQNRVSLAGSEDYQKNVDYDKLVPHLIGAIKELKDRVEALEG